MQYSLNGVHISKVLKFLTDYSIVTTHAIQVLYTHNAAQVLIISLLLSEITSYFDVCFQGIVEYENKKIQMIHLTAEESFWDLSTDKYTDS